ncbi:hypothetical protein ABK040_009950 [Willaertia magna]
MTTYFVNQLFSCFLALFLVTCQLVKINVLFIGRVNAEHFTGEVNSPAYSCSDVLNTMLKRGQNPPASLSNIYFKKRFIDKETTYTGTCYFDIDNNNVKSLAWTEIYYFNIPNIGNDPGLSRIAFNHVMDGFYWKSVGKDSTGYLTKYPSYIEVPFNRIKLKIGNMESSFPLSTNAYEGVDTNSDWKIPSLYHVYNKLDGGSGNLLTNMKIIEQKLDPWNLLDGGFPTSKNNYCNIVAGFRVTSTINVRNGRDSIVDNPSILFGLYALKKDYGGDSGCSAAFWLMGTGFGNNQTTYQQGISKIFNGIVQAGSMYGGPTYGINVAKPNVGGVMVSEGPLDCSRKNYCSLNGRCISSDEFGDSDGVCDCVRDYSGDKSCSLPIYSGQDMLIYLKKGNTFKSLTNRFHAMIEDNVDYDNDGFSFSQRRNNGINFPHLSFGTYSEPFSLPNEFTIIFKVKYKDEIKASQTKYYALSYVYVDNSGKQTTQFSIFFQKGDSKDKYIFSWGTSNIETKEFRDESIFGTGGDDDDKTWIVFRRDLSSIPVENRKVTVQVGQDKQSSASDNALNYKIQSPGILIVGATVKDSEMYDNGLQNSLTATLSNLMVFNRSLSDTEINNIMNDKKFCFKIDSNSIEVCNGVSVCKDFNVCDCPSPFQGQNCELFKQGEISGTKYNYGTTGIPKTLTLEYPYPLLDSRMSWSKLKGTFYCGFSVNQLFKIKLVTTGRKSFTCEVSSPSPITAGVYVNLYYQSPVDTAPVVQVSSGSSVLYFAFNANNLNLKYQYWVPRVPLKGVAASIGYPIKVPTQLKIRGIPYDQTSASDDLTFIYKEIPNPIDGTSPADSQTLDDVTFIVDGNTYGTGKLFVFGQGNTNYAQPNFNALRMNSNGTIVINDFGFSIYDPMKNMMYCSFDSLTYSSITFDSTSNLYACTTQPSNIGVNTLQIYAKGSNNAYGVVSLNPKKFNIYKNDIISYTERLIFLTTESTPSFTIGLSQYSITTPPDFDFRSQIKCLVSGSTIPSTPIVSDSNSVTAVTCQLSISQEGAFNLNVVHDYNPGYLLLSDSNINFYTFSPRNLSPSKFAKLVHTPGDVIVNLVGNGLPYNTDTTAFNYRIVMNSNIIIPSTPQVNGGLVTQFTIAFPSYSTEFYNTDVKLQVVKGTDVIDLSTIQLSIVSQKTISLIGNNYVVIGSNSTLQFALNDTIIPQSVIEGFLCEFNSTYHFPVKFTNNILSCDISNTGTLPGIYTLRLVSGDLTSRISVNDLNIYALGGLYNINYYTPSVFPQSQSYFVKVATNDQSNSFFNLNTTFTYFFQTSISKETFPVDLIKLSDGTITLSSSFKLPGSQTFSLLLSYQGMNFTLNTFDIYFLNTLPLRLHSSSDIAELINNNANIKLETTSYTLQGMTSRFVKCKNEGNYVLSNDADYPTIISCSFIFTSFGFKTISLVYNDSLNAMFDISTSIDFPIIDPKIAQYSVGTPNIGLTSGSLTTTIVTNTWLPNYLQNNVMCIANPKLTTLTVYPSVISTREFSCTSTTNTFGDYYLSLALRVNTGKIINLISNSLPIQFVMTYNADLFTMVQPGVALIGKPIQPILYTNQDIPFNTTVLDYKCGLFYSLSGAPFTSSIALKNPSTNTFVCDPLTVNEPSNNYYITLFVSSRWNPTNNYGVLYSTFTKMIHFTTRRNLELHNSSPVALSGNTKLKATFINNWTIPPNVIAEIKFVIGGNNFSPTSFGSDSISLENGPTLSRGYMQIELWFKSNVSSSFDFALSTNAFQYPFVEQQTVSFNTSFVNGAYVNQPFTSKLRYNGFLGLNSPLSSVAPSLHNRVYCSIGATFVKASRYDYISDYISEFECPLQYSTKGVISGGLYLDTNNGYTSLQNNDFGYH